MVNFNLHHLGEKIIATPNLKEAYDDRLWRNSSDYDERELLGAWNENSQAVLDDILG